MLNGLDLFSGIGGLTLALALWVRPVAYCEIDPYARSVLLHQMGAGALPLAPIWDDVRTLNGTCMPRVDIIYGGFPCQDISIAGTGKGLAGKRSSLFYEIARITGELRPEYVFVENVPAITHRGGSDVVRALTRLGYDCRWCTLSAAAVGANHQRKRWWLLAHASGAGCEKQHPATQPEAPGYCTGGTDSIWRADWWATEPAVGRVAHGVPHRVDRIRGLGNAVVPFQARTAFEILSGLRRPE